MFKIPRRIFRRSGLFPTLFLVTSTVSVVHSLGYKITQIFVHYSQCDAYIDVRKPLLYKNSFSKLYSQVTSKCCSDFESYLKYEHFGTQHCISTYFG